MIPTGVRLDRLGVDEGSEFTSSAFKRYCRDTATKLEFASTPHNYLDQISGQE